MVCTEALAQLEALRYGLLDEATAAGVTSHLAACATCAAAGERLALPADCPAVAPPESLVAQTLLQVRRARARYDGIDRLVDIAAMLLLLFAVDGLLRLPLQPVAFPEMSRASRAENYRELGAYLAEQLPGRRVLLLTAAETAYDPRDLADFVENLSVGFGGRLCLQGWARTDGGAAGRPLSAADLMAAAVDCDVVVSLVGAPAVEDRRRTVVLLGDTCADIEAALRQGRGQLGMCSRGIFDYRSEVRQ